MNVIRRQFLGSPRKSKQIWSKIRKNEFSTKLSVNSLNRKIAKGEIPLKTTNNKLNGKMFDTNSIITTTSQTKDIWMKKNSLLMELSKGRLRKQQQQTLNLKKKNPITKVPLKKPTIDDVLFTKKTELKRPFLQSVKTSSTQAINGVNKDDNRKETVMLFVKKQQTKMTEPKHIYTLKEFNKTGFKQPFFQMANLDLWKKKSEKSYRKEFKKIQQNSNKLCQGGGCKKKDPCKKKEDPCKKKKDPCKKEDPCKKKKDPCKKCDMDRTKITPLNECDKDSNNLIKLNGCKNNDPCKKKEDPCKKKKDPCKKEDPCKKKPDPCKKKCDTRIIPMSAKTELDAIIEEITETCNAGIADICNEIDNIETKQPFSGSGVNLTKNCRAGITGNCNTDIMAGLVADLDENSKFQLGSYRADNDNKSGGSCKDEEEEDETTGQDLLKNELCHAVNKKGKKEIDDYYGDIYKSKTYYNHHKYSYNDIVEHLQNKRLPQPSPSNVKKTYSTTSMNCRDTIEKQTLDEMMNRDEEEVPPSSDNDGELIEDAAPPSDVDTELIQDDKIKVTTSSGDIGVVQNQSSSDVNTDLTEDGVLPSFDVNYELGRLEAPPSNSNVNFQLVPDMGDGNGEVSPSNGDNCKEDKNVGKTS